jgi:ATP-dependent RNA helicase DeaD
MDTQNANGLVAAPPVSDYVAEATFDSFQLSEPVRLGIAEKGYATPTPVQAAAFGPAMQGRDLIVRSKTGTGKTAAFGIPILEKIPAGRRRPTALVMCPTRELAIQVAEEIAALGKHKDLSVVTIYGGASMSDQLEKLKAGAEIVVGTPGRIWDHIRRGTLKLDGMMISCLDEADEMLNMGFFEEVTRILDGLPDDCQQLLFSATVPADIEQIIREYLSDPETILLSGDEYRVDNIQNVFYQTVDTYPKPRNLLYMVEIENPTAAIVFANTRADSQLVTAVLNRNGYDAELLNGDLPQKERERVMAKVKRGEVRFMVATDIAARGIDISDLSHVINYSLPEDPAVYLHRVGRTGRIGKKGIALSLVSGAEQMTLKALKSKYAIEFEERTLPSAEDARRLWAERHIHELKEAMSASIFEAFIPLAAELKARSDGDYLVSFALKYFFTHHRMEKVQDLHKAEHKLVEHVRKEHRAEEKGARRGPPRERDRGPRRDRDGERGRDGERRGGGRDERRVRAERAEAEERGERPARPAGQRTDREIFEESARRATPGEAAPAAAQPSAPLPEATPVAAPPAPAESRPRAERPAAEGPVEVRSERPRREREPRERREPREIEVSVTREVSATREVPITSEGDGDDGEAADRGPRRGKVFLTLGERDGADEAKVREAVAALAPGVELQGLELRRNHTYLFVAPEAVEAAVTALNGKEWQGRQLTAEKAKRRRR